MPKGVKQWAPHDALSCLRRLPARIRIDAAKELVPIGYVVSSPEREALIKTMEAALEVFATRPLQYGPYAERPDPERET